MELDIQLAQLFLLLIEFESDWFVFVGTCTTYCLLFLCVMSKYFSQLCVIFQTAQLYICFVVRCQLPLNLAFLLVCTKLALL